MWFSTSDGAESVDQQHDSPLQGAKWVSLRIADDLIGYPMITAILAAQLYGVSYQSANTAIGKLVESGVLCHRTRGALCVDPSERRSPTGA
jgi:Fic family protein